jgi:hypothetical protein
MESKIEAVAGPEHHYDRALHPTVENGEELKSKEVIPVSRKYLTQKTARQNSICQKGSEERSPASMQATRWWTNRPAVP